MQNAIKFVNAIQLTPNTWAYRDDNTRRWYQISREALVDLETRLATAERIADVYAEWTQENPATELPGFVP